jgi:lipoprotein-releasing system permease protein
MKERVEENLQQPVIVTVVSLLLIFFASIGLILVFVSFLITSDSELGKYFLAQGLAQVCVVPIFRLITGVGMLRGRNWAFEMFLFLTPIFIAVAVISQIYQGYLRLGAFIYISFSIIILISLINPKVIAYFDKDSKSKLVFFLWLRYLHKKKIVFLSIAAVALSVSLLVVVASLFTGFINTFEEAAVIAVGDVLLQPATAIPKYDLLIERLEQTEQVDSATAIISGAGLLHLDKGNVRAVEIWGIQPARRAKVVGFDRFLLKQKALPGEPSFDVPDSPNYIGAFVGIGVLGKPDEKTDKYDYDAAKKMLGSKIVLTTGNISSKNPDDTARPEFNREVVRLSVADIVETGVYQFDNGCIYLPVEELSKILYPSEILPVVQQINIKLADKTDTDVALAVIRGVWHTFVEEQLGADPFLLQNVEIETSRQLQSRLIAAYQMQMNVLLVIFGIVSFSVVLLIFCIFSLIVRLKQKDIAVIKSCGSSSSSVAFIFIGFGGCVGAVGSGIGIILGYIITTNINTIEEWIGIIFGLKLWRSSVYLFNKIPNEVDWTSALPIVLFAIIAAAVGAVIPAVIAARTKPVEILRYE